jgi:hypothetical protein
MPNIEILRKLDHSAILDAIRSSNQMKIERETLRSVPVAGLRPLKRPRSNASQLATAQVISER